MRDLQFTKAHWIESEAWPRVQGRLEDLRLCPPPQVHSIHSWTAIADGAGLALITEQRWLPWPNLAQVACAANLERRQKLMRNLFALVTRWCTSGFVHGDLSPANLLVTADDNLIAVDWVLDLQSREGTPRYVPAKLAAQRKSVHHDEAAALLIVAELGHRPS